MKSTAKAVWNGSLKEGKGNLSALTSFFSQLPYTFNSRFGDGKGGTNPEELIAAAHAGCYSMALSAELGKAGIVPDSIETASTITMDNGNITQSHLVVKARVTGISQENFEKIANETKSACPVSRVLNLEITLDASLL
ncbi:MAG: OsmC family protein [Bacteroidales bacterium]|nr:OsmC family protein [Bacteroidales bacterium]MBN2763962.1 OsmC family protein [Bacteroidales bacterium]